MADGTAVGGVPASGPDLGLQAQLTHEFKYQLGGHDPTVCLQQHADAPVPETTFMLGELLMDDRFELSVLVGPVEFRLVIEEGRPGDPGHGE